MLRNVPYTRPQDTRPTRIVRAAVLQDGHVWTGWRHYQLIHQIIKDTHKTVTQDMQGFWTDDNRFVRRVAAGPIAWKAGQLSDDYPHDKTLLSEYLWDEDGNPVEPTHWRPE